MSSTSKLNTGACVDDLCKEIVDHLGYDPLAHGNPCTCKKGKCALKKWLTNVLPQIGWKLHGKVISEADLEGNCCNKMCVNVESRYEIISFLACKNSVSPDKYAGKTMAELKVLYKLANDPPKPAVVEPSKPEAKPAVVEPAKPAVRAGHYQYDPEDDYPRMPAADQVGAKHTAEYEYTDECGQSGKLSYEYDSSDDDSDSGCRADCRCIKCARSKSCSHDSSSSGDDSSSCSDAESVGDGDCGCDSNYLSTTDIKLVTYDLGKKLASKSSSGLSILEFCFDEAQFSKTYADLPANVRKLLRMIINTVRANTDDKFGAGIAQYNYELFDCNLPDAIKVIYKYMVDMKYGKLKHQCLSSHLGINVPMFIVKAVEKDMKTKHASFLTAKFLLLAEPFLVSQFGRIKEQIDCARASGNSINGLLQEQLAAQEKVIAEHFKNDEKRKFIFDANISLEALIKTNKEGDKSIPAPSQPAQFDLANRAIEECRNQQTPTTDTPVEPSSLPKISGTGDFVFRNKAYKEFGDYVEAVRKDPYRRIENDQIVFYHGAKPYGTLESLVGAITKENAESPTNRINHFVPGGENWMPMDKSALDKLLGDKSVALIVGNQPFKYVFCAITALTESTVEEFSANTISLKRTPSQVDITLKYIGQEKVIGEIVKSLLALKDKTKVDNAFKVVDEYFSINLKHADKTLLRLSSNDKALKNKNDFRAHVTANEANANVFARYLINGATVGANIIYLLGAEKLNFVSNLGIKFSELGDVLSSPKCWKNDDEYWAKIRPAAFKNFYVANYGNTELTKLVDTTKWDYMAAPAPVAQAVRRMTARRLYDSDDDY